jgi:NADH-quinone oxidoreductase subunit G
MPTVIVNDIEVELQEGERLNGIQVAKRAGVEIPHYCWHPGLSVVASCRMCLVETGRRDPETGKVSMMGKLVPACQTPATEHTVFVTNSEMVQKARAMVEEDLLIRHPVDCPICDKAGECHLQDYHFEYGQPERRADIQPFHSRRRSLGDTVTLFVDRCVMCSRCVRFTREISGTSELMVINRGSHEEIDVFPGYPLDNKLSGNVVDLCPVGALGDKDFLYAQRVWFMKKHAHVCGNCSTGCSIWVDENQDQIYRLKPRENPHVNKWWMCDEGRYGFKHTHSNERLRGPEKLTEEGYQIADWKGITAELDQRLRGSSRIAMVLSPWLTVEEAYLLGKYAKQVSDQATLVVGAIPSEGEDEVFQNGFVIRAEKCPNRRGVETIVGRLGETLVLWHEFLERLRGGETFDAIWVIGGYPVNWIDSETAELFDGTATLIVQDLFASPLSERAHYRLPSAASYERAGSFVNANDRLQSFDWAVRPPLGVVTEGQLAWRLLGRERLYDARQTLEDVAREIAYFAAAIGGVPDVGVDLRSNLLVESGT